MYKPTVVVTSPAATRSGYGSRARDVIRALVALDKYDVHVNLVPWGGTPQNALSLDDPRDKIIIDRINYNINLLISANAFLNNYNIHNLMKV